VRATVYDAGICRRHAICTALAALGIELQDISGGGGTPRRRPETMETAFLVVGERIHRKTRRREDGKGERMGTTRSLSASRLRVFL
jgi:hypothetical protein